MLLARKERKYHSVITPKNTLAFYITELIADINSFMIQVPGVKFGNTFFAVIIKTFVQKARPFSAALVSPHNDTPNYIPKYLNCTLSYKTCLE
jgi:cytosine/uracil/thiamine/allantoin permease